MLNTDALNQLRSLKQQIEDDRQRNTGTVKGSQGRFGFVVLDDGREVYLPAEQMQRVFPDDRVTISVVTGEDGKQSGVVDALVESPLRDFTGWYVVRGNAHFVEPDLPRLSRWIFVPPKQRQPGKGGGQQRAPQHGDLVRARIIRHPHADGKPAARIETLIGAADDDHIAARYALARYRLPTDEPKHQRGDLLQPDLATREDLTGQPFVTIDNPDTSDMDDALWAEADGDGWRLHVAIADPTAWIKPGSALERTIAERANTIYLPGLTVPMLPAALAEEHCSLRAGEERAALVCSMAVDAAGNIGSGTFCEARIRSRAKLSYDDVAAMLEDGVGEGIGESIGQNSGLRPDLERLAAVATALRAQRGRDHLLMPDRPEYRLELDTKGTIANIHRVRKHVAHLIVEECMVAANRCAADFLGDNDGIFVSHAGFRGERRPQIEQLLTTHLPAHSVGDHGVLGEYIGLIQALDDGAADPDTPPLRAVLSRWLERSQLCTKAAPHFGMGLTRYTTFTSPIRKYSDYFAHRLIKARLHNRRLPALTSAQLAQLQDTLDRSRQAAYLAEQWLKCLYLQKQPADTLYRGQIAHINSNGFTVRLDDTGIEGFVDTRLLPEKYSFDAGTLRLSTGSARYQLEQPIAVTIAAIDMKKRAIAFAMADAAGPDGAIPDQGEPAVAQEASTLARQTAPNT